MRMALRHLCCCVLAAAFTCATAQADTPLETAVKATYLYKFIPFVGWPPGLFKAADAPFIICIIGIDPFGAVLEEAIKNQHVDTHPITVSRLRVAEPGTDCRIMYISGTADRTTAQALDGVRGTPVLTVTSEGNPQARGIINFVLDNNHVRFEIDDQAAAQNGIAISSKLLDLAISVTPRTAP